MKLNLSIPFETTPSQKEAIGKLEDFFAGNRRVFILKGFAGTGKTSLLGGIARALAENNGKFRLMAPTGRAARVMTRITGFEATTIHRGIYSLDDLREARTTGPDSRPQLVYYFSLSRNTDVTGTLFIVDESSMVSNVGNQGETFRFGSGQLLDDLMEYIRISEPEAGTRILFAGDPAQLPPVGMDTSPALDEEYLALRYKTHCSSATLTGITRQKEGSHIIRMSEMIRKSITSECYNSFYIQADGKELIILKKNEWLEKYLAMGKDKLIIAHKNHTVNAVNREVRKRLRGGNTPIVPGDRVINCSNNYRHGIMNGEFGKILQAAPEVVKRTVHLQGKKEEKKPVNLSWREVMVDFQGRNGDTVHAYMLENFLEGGPVLSPEERQALYVDFRRRHKKLKPRDPEFKLRLQKDPWFNALFLRYGYAVTCHKAQGGEWDDVLVFWDYGFAPAEAVPNAGGKNRALQHPGFFRWAYTAVTRAGKRLFVLEPPCFHPFTGMQDALSFPQGLSQSPTVKNSRQAVVVGFSWQQRLEKAGLGDAGHNRQDHYIRVCHALDQAGVRVTGLNMKYYEVFYTLGRGNETARFKFWLNGKGAFTGRFAPVPEGTTSQAFSDEVARLLENLDDIPVERQDEPRAPAGAPEDEKRLFEQHPFLETLSRIMDVMGSRYLVTIARREHLPYRDRYHFTRHGQRAAVDFIYNGRGFFTRAETVHDCCNSRELLADVKEMIRNLIRNQIPCHSAK